jgi:hypothetical protein
MQTNPLPSNFNSELRAKGVKLRKSRKGEDACEKLNSSFQGKVTWDERVLKIDRESAPPPPSGYRRTTQEPLKHSEVLGLLQFSGARDHIEKKRHIVNCQVLTSKCPYRAFGCHLKV